MDELIIRILKEITEMNIPLSGAVNLENDLSFIRFQESGDQFNKRRLSGTAISGNDNPALQWNGQIDISE
jgi:hypothetical protein